MANQALRGAGRLANTMFGRSNSLSINTGTANSTLYASSSSPPLTSSFSNTSPPIHPTQNPRRSGPSLLGNSIYSHKSTPGPSNLRNEWSDWTDAPPAPDPDRSHDHRKQFTHGSKEAEQVATVAAFPHFDPNWTPPAGPGATSAGAQSTATGNNAPPPLPQAGPAFGTLSNNVLAPRPAQSSAFAFGTQSSSVSTPLPTQSSAFAFGAQSSNASTPRPTQSFAFGTQSSNVPPPSRAPAVGTQPNILQRFSVGIQDNKFLSQTPTTGTQSNNVPAPLPAQSSASGTHPSSVSTPRPTQPFAFGTQSNPILPPAPASTTGTQSNNILSSSYQTSTLPGQAPVVPHQTTSSYLTDSGAPSKKAGHGSRIDPSGRIASLAQNPLLNPNFRLPPAPRVPTRAEVGPVYKGWTVADPGNRFVRPDLMGPGPRKVFNLHKLTPRSGSQQQAGGSQPQQQPQQGGGLFGNSTAQTSQPQAGNSLFGGSLFGGNQQQSQPQQNTQQPSTGGLFGNTQQNAQQNAQQPSTGGLFGNTQQNQTQQEQKPTTGGGLFGGAQTNQTQQNTQQQGGGLFGGMSTNKPATGGSLFGNTTTQQPSGGLFGNTTTQQPSGGLFGNSTAQPANNSLFGNMNQNQQQQQQQQQPSQTSLLGASRYHQSQYQPFVTGRLTMGQGQGGPPQPTATPATKLDWSNVRNTTRFNDLTDEAKQDIEKIDKLISEQEQFCKQIEAFLPNHQSKLQTLGPDVALITEKLEEVDRSLAVDAQGVQQDKNITEKDEIDIARCIRIIDNLRMPAQYIYRPAANSGRQPQPPAWDETYDVDLVGNYFQPLTHDMARLLATYSGHMAEIENHMGTIEQSAVNQAQHLGAQRSGLGGQRDVGADSVRQLADTLRGFEASILAAASKVGACRENVNELVLGKLAGSQSARRW